MATCATFAAGLVLGLPTSRPNGLAAAAGAARPGRAGQRHLVVNADDFGMAPSVSRGILDAHAHGVVTSTSLMVTSSAAEQAVAEARRFPELSLGLHADFTSSLAPKIRMDDVAAVAGELDRQIDRFVRLVGAPPTHLDSHHHVHGRFNWARIFLDAGARLGVPVRGFSTVVYVSYYAHWPGEEQSDPRHVSYEVLAALAAGLGPGVSEIGCHPGYFGPGVDRAYGREREFEVEALTDARLRQCLEREGVRLVSYRDARRLTASLTQTGLARR